MADPFEDFWTASRLTPLTQRRLAAHLAEYRQPDDALDPLVLPGPRHRLGRPSDRLRGVFRRRASVREFSARPLRASDLGALLSPLAVDRGRRGYPSAGGLYPVRTYPVLLNVAHALNGRACRYDPGLHALQDVGPAPGWEDLGPLLAAAPGADRPHVVLVFVLTDAGVLDKYGQRGGRFALIEAGCAAQSVAIRLAQRRLGGYLLGAGADAALLRQIGLDGATARFAVALACGRGT